MAEQQPLNDGEREELIAYLDGELTETDAQAVEKKLGTDPKYRAEADALRQTYNLLDYLPKPAPSQTFTNRTLERVSVVRPTLSLPNPGGLRRWVLRLSWVAAIMLVGLAGYAGVGRLPSSQKTATQDLTEEQEAELVRDFRAIEQLGQAQHVNDIFLLYELDRPELFGDEPGY
jgi:anti-sigma factor RsiW